MPAQRRVAFGSDTLIVAARPFGESDGLRWRLVVAVPESDFTAQTQTALEKTLAVIALAIALAAALAIWLAYRFTWRFKGLALAAQQLGRGEVPELQSHARVMEVQRLSSALRSSASTGSRTCAPSPPNQDRDDAARAYRQRAGPGCEHRRW